MNQREVISLLQKKGWEKVKGGGKGSHQKMKKNGKMTIVPDNKDLPVKTLKKIEEQTGEKIRK